MTDKGKRTFGQTLREARLRKACGLRRFADMIGVSPTYLSQVEQDNADPPTVERVRRMAELLGENVDEWIALAGRVPEDLPKIIQEQPTQMPELLREVSGMTPEELRKVIDRAKRIKREGS